MRRLFNEMTLGVVWTQEQIDAKAEIERKLKKLVYIDAERAKFFDANPDLLVDMQGFDPIKIMALTDSRTRECYAEGYFTFADLAAIDDPKKIEVLTSYLAQTLYAKPEWSVDFARLSRFETDQINTILRTILDNILRNVDLMAGLEVAEGQDKFQALLKRLEIEEPPVQGRLTKRAQDGAGAAGAVLDAIEAGAGASASAAMLESAEGVEVKEFPAYRETRAQQEQQQQQRV